MASMAAGSMPSACSVRPSLVAASDTILSARSSSTWSGVSSGVGMNWRKNACSFASPNGSGISHLRRSLNVVRALGLHRLEALLAALVQDADEVDRHVRAFKRALDRGRIAQVRLYGVDLPHAPHRLQMPGKVRPAHRVADAIALARERTHQVAADEARAAEHRDQRFGGNFGHGMGLVRAAGVTAL